MAVFNLSVIFNQLYKTSGSYSAYTFDNSEYEPSTNYKHKMQNQYIAYIINVLIFNTTIDHQHENMLKIIVINSQQQIQPQQTSQQKIQPTTNANNKCKTNAKIYSLFTFYKLPPSIIFGILNSW